MKQVINTEHAPAPIGPYNQAIQAGDFLFVSGQIPISPESGELVVDHIDSETRQVMENLKHVLQQAGYAFTDVVKTSIFLSDMGLFNSVNAIYGQYFEKDTAPARETIAVKALPKNVNVEISLIAHKSD